MERHRAAAAALLLLTGSPLPTSAQDAATPTPVDPTTTAAAEPSVPLIKIDALSRTITLSADGSFREVQHSEIESSNQALIAQLAQFPISYDDATQTLDISDAYTLKLDGRKEMVGPSGIFDRTAPSNNNVLSSLKQKVIIFPDVQPGDRIIYDATIAGKALIPGQFTYDRVMAPVTVLDKESDEIIAPKSVPLYTDTPQLTLTKKEIGDTVSYSTSFSNPRAIPDDTNPIGRFDRVPRFSVSTFRSYDDLSSTYAAMAVPKIQVTPDIQARADTIVAGTTDRREKAQKLYDWVSSHIRYVAIELGTGGLVPHDASSVLANGYGDCKDQAVLYSALLAAEKIDADLSLIRSGNTYTVAKVPTIGSFNHVIVYIPQLELYADTTSAGLVPFGFLPQQEYGKPTLLVSVRGGGLRQTPVPSAKEATFTYTLTAKLDDAGHDDSTSTLTATGSFLEPLHGIGKAIQFDTQSRIPGIMFKAHGTAEAQGGFAVSPDVASESYQIKGAYKTPGALVAYTQNRNFVIPDSLRITPLTSTLFFGPIFDSKYGKADAIPCHAGRGVDDETLEFSTSRKLLHLPDDKRVSTEHLTYISHWSLDGNVVHVHRELETRFDRAVCTNPVKDEALSVFQTIRSDLATQISLVQASAPAAQ